MLYIETPAANRAFAQALESTRVFEDVHGNQTSEVQMLLQAYALANPNDPVISQPELTRHQNVSAVDFQMPVHQEFLRRLEKSVRERWQVEVTIRPPLLSLRKNPGKLPVRIDNQ